MVHIEKFLFVAGVTFKSQLFCKIWSTRITYGRSNKFLYKKVSSFYISKDLQSNRSLRTTLGTAKSYLWQKRDVFFYKHTVGQPKGNMQMGNGDYADGKILILLK